MARHEEAWNLLTEAQTASIKAFLQEVDLPAEAVKRIRQGSFIHGAKGTLRQLQKELMKASKDPVWKYKISRLRLEFDEDGNLVFIGPESIRNWLETEDAGPMGQAVWERFELEDDYISAWEIED